MLKVLRVGALLLIPVGLLLVGWLLLRDAYIPVLDPSGEVATKQRDLLVFTTALSLLVVIPVYSLLLFFVIRYRSGNKKKAKYSPNWSENKLLETLWWGIPIAVIAVLAVVTYQTSHSLDPYKPLAGEDTLEVEVVALRWKWLFFYPQEGVATLNHLPLPVNRPVHFTLTADAPMSAFWIPALGSQVYAMNGMKSQLNLRATSLGNFTGYTTNINGKGYADMTFTTKVMSEGDFDEWTADAASNKKAQFSMNTYETLAEPESITTENTYQLGDADIFQAIVHKNMGHGSHTETSGGNE